jgi:hypothetical protein
VVANLAKVAQPLDPVGGAGLSGGGLHTLVALADGAALARSDRLAGGMVCLETRPTRRIVVKKSLEFSIARYQIMLFLLQQFYGGSALDVYGEFISALRRFEVFCIMRSGKSREDYVEIFEMLKRSFDQLFDKPDDEVTLYSVAKSPASLITEIGSILSDQRVTNKDLEQISVLISKFFEDSEKKFRYDYIEYSMQEDARREYPQELYSEIAALIGPDIPPPKFDSAIVAAFKYLENLLRNRLNVSPYEYYGEDLINYAFSPRSGVLQLGTHPNEQAGLRNMFSGAYALFRNPSAHRSVKYEDFDAMAIVAMAVMMSHIVMGLNKPDERDAPNE